MEPSEVRRAVAAGVATASGLGLDVDDAEVLHNSNRIAVRLLPCDALARIAPPSHEAGATFEVEVAERLAAAGCPIAGLESRVDPLVYWSDGFAVTLWTYYEPVSDRALPADEYADALVRLHTGMRRAELTAPHFTDRVAGAESVLADPALSPELGDADREFLATTLRRLTDAIVARGADEQLLHGEPHPGNLLRTRRGPLFIDLETCCRGPVEFDIAHAPPAIAARYPTADQDLVRQCRVLMGAMVTTWRWEDADQLPNRDHWRIEGLQQLRAAVDR